MKTTKSKKKVAKANTVATVKSAVVAEPAATAPKVAVNIERERMDVGVANLTPAPWNPRGEISPESVADLVASIATVGVIEPIVAMPTAASLPNVLGPVYIIIAGHRRVKAAKLAGIATVPCDILKGIDAATAKRMTFIENLQRRDADPILEANLVAELVADGMTTDEIAAEIGRDRKWVLRRKNLSNLSPSWRKRIEKGEKITTDCLEHIAAFPAELQEKMKKEWTHHSTALRWCDLERCFNNESQNLSKAPFDTTPCKSCANNTGCSPDLFEWERKPATLGKCLCAKCYRKKCAAHVAAIVKQAENDGTLIIRNSPDYYVKTSPTKTKKCSALYVFKPYYTSYKDEIKVEWGEPPKKESGLKMSAEEREADLAAKREKREHNKAIRHLVELCADNNLANWLKSLAANRVTAPFIIQRLFVGIDSYRLVGTETEIEKAALVFFLEDNWPAVIPEGYWKSIAAAVVLNTNPSRNSYTADTNAGRIVALFSEELRAAGLTNEEADRILPPTAKDKLAKLSVKWGERANEPEEADESGDDGDGADGTDSSEE